MPPLSQSWTGDTVRRNPSCILLLLSLTSPTIHNPSHNPEYFFICYFPQNPFLTTSIAWQPALLLFWPWWYASSSIWRLVGQIFLVRPQTLWNPIEHFNTLAPCFCFDIFLKFATMQMAHCTVVVVGMTQSVESRHSNRQCAAWRTQPRPCWE